MQHDWCITASDMFLDSVVGVLDNKTIFVNEFLVCFRALNVYIPSHEVWQVYHSVYTAFYKDKTYLRTEMLTFKNVEKDDFNLS